MINTGTISSGRYLALAVLIAGMTMSLINCADTYSWIDRVEPRFYITDPDNPGRQDIFSIVDSIKLSKLQPNDYTYTFSVTANIDEVLKEMIINTVNGGTLKANGNVVTNGSIIPLNASNRTVIFVWEIANTDLTYTLNFTAKDLGGLIGTPSTVTLIAKRNWDPVPKLTLEKITNASYWLDASESYDQDDSDHFGGEIAYRYGGLKTYTFIISGAEDRTFSTETPRVKYGFPISGNYTIVLKVNDNDGAQSGGTEPQQIAIE